MRVLKQDVFSRRQPGAKERRRSGVALFALGLVSLALLILSRIEHPAIRQVRVHAAEVLAPVLAAIAVPLWPIRRLGQQLATYAATADELDRMRAELQAAKSWEARARELERRLADLGQVARVIKEPGLDFITGRIIADATGPFARSVLLNGGREAGLKGGFPVISGDGLVGRVLETGTRASRILLLTDINSRVPVLVGSSGLRAILVGDNTRRPLLAHLADDARVAAGDEIVTSGVGGLFPRGLRIGTVASDDDRRRVELHARFDQLDHVSVLFYESPALEIAGETPRRSASEPAQRRALSRRGAGEQ